MIQTQPNPQKLRRQAYMMGIIALVMAGFGAYLVAAGALPTQYNLVMGQTVPGIKAPEGYEAWVFQTNLAAPRFMVAHPQQNVLFVAERGAGRIIALRDEDGNHEADSIQVVVDKLAAPTGLAWQGDWLYVAQADEVTRIRLDGDLQEVERQTIIPDLPLGKNSNEIESNLHAMLIHDSELYLSIGASCAGCQESDSRRATVMVYNLDGSNERVFARGLYLVLGLTVNPVTGQVWASNQGRPKFDPPAPETIYALQNADDAGWFGCIAGDMVDPQADNPQACEGVLQPLLKVTPQANITDLLFLENPTFAPEYVGDLLFVLHGGVVGEGRDGKQVEFGVYRVDIDEKGQLASEPSLFVEGFWISEEPGDFLGRPFGLAMLPNGSLFISDDASGAVYEVRRQ